MPDRSLDWLRQAEKDLDAAGKLRAGGHHEWTCFAAQQSAENAVKAAHYSLKQDVRGHRIAELLAGLAPGVVVPQLLIEKARTLDTFYIPARYPNSHASGAPFENFGPLQSEQAISYAREILQFARLQVAG